MCLALPALFPFISNLDKPDNLRYLWIAEHGAQGFGGLCRADGDDDYLGRYASFARVLKL